MSGFIIPLFFSFYLLISFDIVSHPLPLLEVTMAVALIIRSIAEFSFRIYKGIRGEFVCE